RFNVAWGMLTAKFVALMFLKVLSVRPLLFVAGVVAIPLLFVPLPLLLLFVTVWFGVVNWMQIGPFAVGGCSPRSRIFSRETCRIATSTTTSALDLSKSLTIFSASATWSG